MRTFTLSLFAAAFVLVATQAATAQVGPYCLTDGFGYVWDIEPDGPTDILLGSTTNVYPVESPIVGGRGRSNTTIRHHSLTTLNADRGLDPSCVAQAGFNDWFSYNGTVTGNSSPFGFSGDWVNACGATGTFSGTISAGACPEDAPRWNDGVPALGTPMAAPAPEDRVEVSAAERGGAVYCLIDGFGYEWEVFPEGPIGGPSGLITGTADAAGDFEVAGGRGRSASTIRHHSIVAINPAALDDGSCVAPENGVDWFTYNGKVTGNSSPFTFSGDWLNSCGSTGTFTGSLSTGACPLRPDGEVALDGPNAPQMSEDEIAAAAATVEALGVSVFPNPAVDEARISYSLDASAEVRLVVYDMLGRQVATLVDGTQEAGAHTATFDARGMASGLYVYHLVAGERTVAGQLSLTR